MKRILSALLCLLALPALAQSPFISTVSQASVAVAISTATTTKMISAAAGKQIYLTSYQIVAGGTGNIKFVYGTGSTCGTGTTDLTGNMPMVANGNITFGSGIAPILILPPAVDLCITTSAAVVMAGVLNYAQF